MRVRERPIVYNPTLPLKPEPFRVSKLIFCAARVASAAALTACGEGVPKDGAALTGALVTVAMATAHPIFHQQAPTVRIGGGHKRGLADVANRRIVRYQFRIAGATPPALTTHASLHAKAQQLSSGRQHRRDCIRRRCARYRS
jgi:hypothetical protein